MELKTVRMIEREKVPNPQGFTPNLDPPPLFDIEIGAGVGMHAIRYCLQNPNRHLVAIEHTREKFEKFQRRFQNHGSPANLNPLHANAISYVTHGLSPRSVDRIFILYPNPNLRDSSLNKRWHAMPFMHVLLGTLKPEGTLELATNVERYAEEARRYFNDFWKLKELEFRKFDSTSGIEPRTHFEKKYLLNEESCFNLIFQA